MFCIGDLDAVVSTPTGVPLIAIFQSATGSVGGALGLTILITTIALVSLWFLMAQSSRVVFSLYDLQPPAGVLAVLMQVTVPETVGYHSRPLSQRCTRRCTCRSTPSYWYS